MNFSADGQQDRGSTESLDNAEMPSVDDILLFANATEPSGSGPWQLLEGSHEHTVLRSSGELVPMRVLAISPNGKLYFCHSIEPLRSMNDRIKNIDYKKVSSETLAKQNPDVDLPTTIASGDIWRLGNLRTTVANVLHRFFSRR